MTLPEAGGKAHCCLVALTQLAGVKAASTNPPPRKPGQLGNRKFTDMPAGLHHPFKPDHSQLSSVASAHESLISRKQKHCT